MTPYSPGSADCHHRKRSFDLVNDYSTTRPSTRHGPTTSVSSIDHQQPSTSSSKKRRPPLPRSSNMPIGVAVGSIMSTPFPSFMTVVGETDASTPKDLEELSMPDSIQSDTQILVTDAKHPSISFQPPDRPLHHRDSVTSMTTTSTDSSPTTTNSTFDSPLLTDPSPSSSPESATSIPPVSPFRNIMARPLQEQPCESQPQKEPSIIIPHAPSIQPPPPIDTSKNVKNLSLNMSAVALPRPSTAPGFESSHAFSAPTSPLKDTPRTGRKKPTNLTIRTPGFQQLSFSRTLDVPPTPSSRPSLHHMQSSPSLASLASPTKPPSQGLFLHLPASGTIQAGSGSDSSNSTQSGNSALPELKEEDEFHPQRSQETQEQGYPTGPVLIYDSGVYLYLEPTAEEATKEIKTPFEIEAPILEISEPQTAISEISFKSAWEWPRASETPTPTTPRPTSFLQKKQPEYMHIPWDHNSEILEDLYNLCRVIDERVQAGKKVLVHCQLGVSRSASLVIAYGLYKGYQPDFHSMYMSVKQRSQWVGPNMSLIYQLTDFRSKVVKGVYGDHTFNPKPTWWKVQDSSSPVMDTPIAKKAFQQLPSQSWERPAMVVAPSNPDATSTAPGRPSLRLNKALPPVPLFPKNDPVDIIETPVKLSEILGKIATPPKRETLGTAATVPESRSPPQSVSPRPLPFRERFDDIPPASLSPDPSKTPKLGLVTSSPVMDLAAQDVPDTPSLFSPRATEFMASPFGITTAGDLAVVRQTQTLHPPKTKGLLLPHHIFASSAEPSGDQMPTAIDPRSPHQQGEAPEILRNIDDFL
ncbi:tyrosine/serine/threonine protein phosphatase [Exophiala xenobiotica]|nr:tyrosine/serine/threonine protein phosphatase [Exophiala xenobiotica]KAK5247005.1 tyrosine/serine/threonine protein phosphatase [Exophiala xenobiotica]KAK5351932.1 tyrosine/serine/threonine protein phosphatase [Exophiala xenobiotica]KAK5371434.1 tyrosine/serine/threonine protein phosphatase [Exophiala xenobiotica]KAK5380860.1 tyrosine/serine/threonine protein phosphatase [Exophiala xenobiotica]